MKQFKDITPKDVENEELQIISHHIIAHAATVPYVTDNEKEGSKKVASSGTISDYLLASTRIS